tara:strand:+ start:396 stop:707 length:312 start_codon:yes stop_codon:yes gene_type:complete
MIKLKDILNEKQQLNEKRKMGEKGLMSVKRMTDKNQHTENRRMLSSLMKNKKLEKFYLAMAELNDVFGGYGPELSKLNTKMEQELYKSIRKSFLNAEEIIGLL